MYMIRLFLGGGFVHFNVCIIFSFMENSIWHKHADLKYWNALCVYSFGQSQSLLWTLDLVIYCRHIWLSFCCKKYSKFCVTLNMNILWNCKYYCQKWSKFGFWFWFCVIPTASHGSEAQVSQVFISQCSHGAECSGTAPLAGGQL